MIRYLLAVALAVCSFAASALQPYVAADKVTAGDVKSVMAAAEQKLSSAGFTVIGRHLPPGLPQYGSLVVTDAGLTDAIRQIGGSAVIGAPIRVGVKADGSVSYVNLDYWERAYLRANYAKADAAVKAASAKLAQALGSGQPMGGDVPADNLAKYHYMMGMEYFDERSELKEYPDFDAAVKAVQGNLAEGVAQTAKVYEVVMPEQKVAVFGVAMNDKDKGEGWWVNKIGPDHIAALPWEVYVVNGKVYGLYGRYRTALGWPELGMGQFMGIMSHPDTTRKMLESVAGAE
jgi:hypothetical protein